MHKSSAISTKTENKVRLTSKLQLDRRLIGAVLFGAIPALLLVLSHYQVA
jgi:hypothetical protein